MFGWLLYGNLIYFSKQNDCVRHRETRLLAYVALAYIYVGYIQIGYALSFAYVLPFALKKWCQLKQRERTFRDQIKQISKTLARRDFDP